jgi:hypothetical protein
MILECSRFTEVMNKAVNYNKNKGVIDAIPILIYHRINNSREDYSTTTDLFEAKMEYLHDKGFTVLNIAGYRI